MSIKIYSDDYLAQSQMLPQMAIKRASEFFPVFLIIFVVASCDGRMGPRQASPTATSSPSTISAMPRKPTPAVGASDPTTNSFSSTTGLPFDFFSGMSYRQLETVRETIEMLNVFAAQSANVTVNRGREVFGKVANYILALWFPEDAVRIGLPPNTNGVNGGDSPSSLANFWNTPTIDSASAGYGRSLSRLLNHLVNLDPIGYVRVEDDIAYSGYLSYVARRSPYDIVALYLHDTLQQTAAANFFLGSAMTDEVKSALYTVFRFINWHRAVVAALYQTKNYARFEGRTDDACLNVELLDLAPVSVDYPYMSNGSVHPIPTATSKYGPVTPDGQPMASQMFGRALDDPSYYSNEVTTSDITASSNAIASSSTLIPRPIAATGATPLSPYPYAATAGVVVDRFSGISFRELGIASTAWSEVVKAAAEAGGVSVVDGAKVLHKQLAYTFLLWHGEYSEVTGYRNAEEMWTNATLDADFVTKSVELNSQIVGLTQNNEAATIRSIDRVAFAYYLETRSKGQAWYTLSYFAFQVDAALESAKFFLGVSLTDEKYSALESVFSYLYLKTYQTYHAYYNGYRVRPFVSDFELIGIVKA